MVRIVIALVGLTFIFSGLGNFVLNLFNIEKKGFSLVIGFVAFFACIQALYYPAQVFNLSFKYIVVVSLIFLFIALLTSLYYIKDILREFLTFKTLIIGVSLVLFTLVYANTFLDIELSDASTYLNYIAQNINIDKLNMFNPSTGKMGQEWDVFYLYQGYYHFASFATYFINLPYFWLNSSTYIENIVVITWLMGLMYSLISSVLIINLLDYFKLKNKFLYFGVVIYLLFYNNFYYWKVAFAFYGNTYRIIFTSLLVYIIYRWLKEDNENIKYLIPLNIFAGLAFTSSYLFIAFVIMFALAIYLFMIEKPKTIYDMFTLVFPMALYGLIMFGKVYTLVLVLVGSFVILIYGGRLFKPVRRTMYYMDDFFYKHIKLLVAGFVILLVVISLYINLNIKGYVASYSHFFNNHQKYDMVKDYYFIYSNILDNVLNVIRWLGLVFVILKADTKETKFIKTLVIICFLVFLNPLTFSAVAYGITGIVYYRLIDVVFNPFIEILILISVYKVFDFNNLLKNAYLSTLILVTLAGNVFSWVNINEGLYTFYINGGKNTLPLEKISYGELQAIKELEKLVDPNDPEVVVLSQTNALRTFIPQAYQLFTSRDYFYTSLRLNDDFYEISRRHYSWDSWDRKKDANYENTCKYIGEYEVDLILLEYWENHTFDYYSGFCSEAEFTGANFKVKRVVDNE